MNILDLVYKEDNVPIRYRGEWNPSSGSLPTNLPRGSLVKSIATAVIDGVEYKTNDLILLSDNWNKAGSSSASGIGIKDTWQPSIGQLPDLNSYLNGDVLLAIDTGFFDGVLYTVNSLLLKHDGQWVYNNLAQSYARLNHSHDYDELPISEGQVTNWNSAYGWGDHSQAGYLTSETDPTVPSHVKSIANTDISNWNTAYNSSITGGSGTGNSDLVLNQIDGSTITIDLSHGHTNATGVAAGFMSSTDKTKLDNIENNATQNNTDAFLLNRENHTGTQTLSSISDAGLLASKNTIDNSDFSGTPLSIANGGTGETTVSGIKTLLSIDNVDNVSAADLRDRSTHTGTQSTSTISGLDTTLGLKADLVNGTVPASQLPSYVDDVLEFSDASSFPATGESGKIYVAEDTDSTWRWSSNSSSYVQIGGGGSGLSSTDDLSEGSVNLYFTDTRARSAMTGAISGLTTSNLTFNRALISDGSGKIVSSPVTSTELGYLDGVTSAIQTQINSKENSSNKVNSLGSPDSTTFPTTQAVADQNYAITTANNSWTGINTYDTGTGIGSVAPIVLKRGTNLWGLGVSSFNNSFEIDLNDTIVMRITDGEGIVFGGANDGSQGAGTVNATGLYVNGVSVSTSDTNTTYSAGTGLSLSGTTFSVDNPVTSTQINNWDTAHGWGNHANAGYLTSLPSHNHDSRYLRSTVKNSSLLLSNRESTDITTTGEVVHDESAGLYVSSSNASYTSPALQWSHANFTAGGGLSVSYDAEDKPTLSLSGDSFSSSGNYANLRARATTASDVGASPSGHGHTTDDVNDSSSSKKFLRVISGKSGNEAADTYPSIFTIQASGGSDLPSAYGSLVSFGNTTVRNFQLFHKKDSLELYLRYWHSTDNVWNQSLVPVMEEVNSGNFYATGDVRGGFSDERLKEVVEELSGSRELIRNWKAFTYLPNELARELYKGDPGLEEDIEVGLGANSVHATHPMLTTNAAIDLKNGKSKTGENYLNLKYDRTAPVLVNAINEQSDIVDDHTKHIKNLEKQMLQVLKLLGV